MTKLAFREDEAAGVVRCFVSALDDSGRTEVGTLALGLLRADPGLFDRWVGVMRGAYAALLATCGVEVLGFQVFRPGDKN